MSLLEQVGRVRKQRKGIAVVSSRMVWVAIFPKNARGMRKKRTGSPVSVRNLPSCPIQQKGARRLRE
jgi:hypothetical protein